MMGTSGKRQGCRWQLRPAVPSCGWGVLWGGGHSGASTWQTGPSSCFLCHLSSFSPHWPPRNPASLEHSNLEARCFLRNRQGRPKSTCWKSSGAEISESLDAPWALAGPSFVFFCLFVCFFKASFLGFFFKMFSDFIYFWLCWVFVSVRGLSLVVASGGHSSSRCAGLSLSRLLLLQSTGSRRAGSLVVAHGPSCSVACGIFPHQGSNPCPLHWQADSQPLRHQGSPPVLF